jgi:raffinose/stachyose/melibiose transport system permease protein
MTSAEHGRDLASRRDAVAAGGASRGNRRPAVLGALPFLLPALAFYGIFVIYPMFTAVQLSLSEWNGLAGSPSTFVGLDNYRRVFVDDPVFWTAFRNSLVWVVLSLLVPTTLSLGLALALDRALFGRAVFRTVFYIPAVVAAIAVATTWRWMYNPQFGIINETLRAVGLETLIRQWLGDPGIALYSIFVASIWQVAGINMVLFLAGLQNVNKDEVDAAQVDGAGAVATFRHITLPALRPTILVVVVLTIINSLKVFDLIYGMTGGGPAQSTQVLALWSYTLSFGTHVFGQGNAVATVLLFITLLIVVPYLVWLLRQDDER